MPEETSSDPSERLEPLGYLGSAEIEGRKSAFDWDEFDEDVPIVLFALPQSFYEREGGRGHRRITQQWPDISESQYLWNTTSSIHTDAFGNKLWSRYDDTSEIHSRINRLEEEITEFRNLREELRESMGIVGANNLVELFTEMNSMDTELTQFQEEIGDIDDRMEENVQSEIHKSLTKSIHLPLTLGGSLGFAFLGLALIATGSVLSGVLSIALAVFGGSSLVSTMRRHSVRLRDVI